VNFCSISRVERILVSPPGRREPQLDDGAPQRQPATDRLHERNPLCHHSFRRPLDFGELGYRKMTRLSQADLGKR
jgi:hypothetical protein